MTTDGDVDFADQRTWPAGLRLKLLDDERVTERLRVLDKICFPVVYTDKFYAALVTNGWHDFSFIALYHDALVGGITSRIEAIEGSSKFKLYVMTLGVLPAYRHMGIGRLLLASVLKNAEKNPDIEKVTLHVQDGSAAVRFYQHFGFTAEEKVPNYYTNIEPTNDALYLVKSFAPRAKEGTAAPDGKGSSKRK